MINCKQLYIIIYFYKFFEHMHIPLRCSGHWNGGTGLRKVSVKCAAAANLTLCGIYTPQDKHVGQELPIFLVSFAGGFLLEHPAWSFASLPAATNACSYDCPFRLRRM